MVGEIFISEYQTKEYKAEPVGYSALHAYGAPYFNTCHCLSSLYFNILRVVAATVPSESELQSWTILWLNTSLRISSLLPSALRKKYLRIKPIQPIHDLEHLYPISTATYKIQYW